MTWRSISLDTVIAIIESGSRPKGGASGEWGDVPSLGGENILKSGGVTLNGVKLVPATFYRRMTKGHLCDGDVLINKDGALTGKVGWYHAPDTAPACINEHLFLLRGIPERITQGYLYYTLLSETVQFQIRAQISGSAQPGLKSGFVKAITTKLPESVDEQSQVVEVLSTVDQAIAQTEALISKQRRIKTGLMQDLLTRGINERGNLRSEQNHEFKDSPLGWIPMEWDVMSLEFALKKAQGFLQTGPFGSQLHAYEYTHEGIPVIMPQDISAEGISTDNIARVPEQRAKDLRRHRVQPNDVVFSRRGDLSRAAAISEGEFGWLCGTGCFLARIPTMAIEAKWLADVYRHHRVQSQVYANAVGSTMPSLNNNVMEHLKIAFPSIREQQEIARRHEAIDAVIRSLKDHLQKLKNVKIGLMQDLLSGKRRVSPLF